MSRELAISTEALEEILAWLNSDRGIAVNMYVQLRHDLEHLFSLRGCADPEELTDEVINRVARKVHEVRPTFKGDARHYFHAVAKNVAKEDFKARKRRVSLEDVEPLQPEISETDEEVAEVEECLQQCLQNLSKEKRELILAYYARAKQAKIDYRNELARQLGISVETLRVRVYRMRVQIGECINDCLSDKGRVKMKRIK